MFADVYFRSGLARISERPSHGRRHEPECRPFAGGVIASNPGFPVSMNGLEFFARTDESGMMLAAGGIAGNRELTTFKRDGFFRVNGVPPLAKLMVNPFIRIQGAA